MNEWYFIFGYFFGYTPEEVDKMDFEVALSMIEKLKLYYDEISRQMKKIK